MRKKLLYISVYDPHVPYTGAGVRGAQFVSQLAKNFDLDLVYMEGSGHPGDVELEKKFEYKITDVQTRIKVPFAKKDYFIFSKNLYAAAKKRLESHSYDYIIADYGLSARYAYVLSKKFHVPYIYCSHNIEFRQYWGKIKSDPRRLPLIPYVYHVEKKGCKKAKLVVAISEDDATFYTRWISRQKIIIIPQGFDESVYNPFYEPKENHPKVILFFGNYNISTNRDAVYVARDYIVEHVVSKFPDVVFQFIGANPPTDIRHPNIKFMGFVDNLAPYIKQADVVISPIMKGWGMPTKIIESLACGKPVVATEAAARAIPKNYRTLHVISIKGFAEKIIDLLKRDRPVNTADFDRLKKEFGWEGIINRLVEKIRKY